MKRDDAIMFGNGMHYPPDNKMRCLDFSSEDSRCGRGIPVAPLFSHYFCTGKHENCPLKTMPDPKDVLRPGIKSITRRKS